MQPNNYGVNAAQLSSQNVWESIFIIALVVALLGSFATLIWMWHESSSVEMGRDFVGQNKSDIKQLMVERAASYYKLDPNMTAMLLHDADRRDLNIRWCTNSADSAYLSYYVASVHCYVYVKLKDPLRITLDARYWVKIDRENKQFFKPMSDVPVIDHGLSESNFYVETYGKEIAAIVK